VRISHCIWLNETDERGYFIPDKRALVTFQLYDIDCLVLENWNHQNVIDELDIEPSNNAYRLTLHDIFGVSGSLTAKIASVSVEPLIT
jgi:hypothetical protein